MFWLFPKMYLYMWLDKLMEPEYFDFPVFEKVNFFNHKRHDLKCWLHLLVMQKIKQPPVSSLEVFFTMWMFSLNWRKFSYRVTKKWNLEADTSQPQGM